MNPNRPFRIGASTILCSIAFLSGCGRASQNASLADVCDTPVSSGSRPGASTLAPPPPLSIFCNSARPSNIAQATQSIELGVKFKADVNGFISGVKFYKDALNTGTHTGTLWGSTGTLLATTTFISETASGWQSSNFTSPVAISANTIYVISYHTDTGHYAGDLGYFATFGADNGPLHAPSNPIGGGNGVFKTGPTGFPSSVYQASNYWVDVLYTAASGTPAPFIYSPNPAVYTKGAAIVGNAPSPAAGSATSYSVAPLLPPGLSLTAATGVISGTPSALLAATNYTVTATNSAGNTTATVNIAVNDGAPSGLIYSSNPATYIKGTAIANNNPSSSGGAITSYAVSPALPAGLQLNSTSGLISGTPTAVISTTNYSVTGTNSGGSTSAVLAITINDSAPSGLVYSLNPAVYTKGTAIANNTPSNSGGAVVSYSVSPALPSGLNLSATTGVISGTPGAAAAAASYSVTATNSSGSTSAVVNIGVNDTAPSGLTYSVNPATYTKGTAIANNTPISAGAITSYAVSPALPAGLSLNSTTGVISGTATAITANANYTVTGTNGGGSAIAVLSITVNDVAPAGLVYSTNPAAYTKGTAIANNTPSNSGGAVVSYSVSPALPSGLNLSATTGVVSGTPAAAAAAASYNVTATNSGGSTSAAVNITVNDVVPSGPLTIFGSSQPLSFAASVQSLELGVKFKADVNGFIIGGRFFKDVNNTGAHSASLWSSTGTLLATTAYSGETPSGWQSANFAAPVAITANTIYVISYHTDAGHQAGDLNYFTTSGKDTGVLHAPSSPAVGGNGVFIAGATAFPTQTYLDSNYWVDVTFSTTNPGPPPPPPPPPPGATVAFPGASGGGAQSLGGRGGTVILVTNTADSGAGSLRACVDAVGPRTCVFRTGGTITLINSLAVYNPFITIAGQTAPGGGIQLAGPNSAGNPSLQVSTHDVVVQYLRVRRGHNAGEICNANPWSCGASVEVLDMPSVDPYNIVFDHLSSEWSNYDSMIVLGSNSATSQPRAITVSQSILGEALAGAGQTVGANFGGYSGQGPTTPDAMVELDLHHNLFAGFSHRMPLLTVKSARLVNNIVYGWTYYGMRSKGFRDFIGNYFKVRSGQTAASHEIHAWTENAGNDTSFAPSFYLSGNAGPSDPGGTANWTMTALAINESAGEASSPLATTYQRSSPIPTPTGYVPMIADPVATISSASGPMLNTARAAPYDGVGASRKLDCASKWVDAQDVVDSRIVKAVANGTTLYGSYDYSSLSASPQSQADLGGWPALSAGIPCADVDGNGLPDVWESYWAGQLKVVGTVLDPKAFSFGDGYTNLEHYLSGLNPSP
jgi:hypothetical protein